MKNIGILGGSFNPIHCGHLNIAETAACKFKLQRVLFIPCKISPFKTGAAAEKYVSDEHRLAMIQLSLEGHSNFELSEIELSRGGVSYSYETVLEIKNMFPEADLFFIIGSDSLLTLSKWHKIEALLNLCNFVTVERPGIDRQQLEQSLDFPPEVSRRLLRRAIRGRLMDISSSEIREKVAEGTSLQGLVPKAVEEYIARQGLYQRA
ncbi:MAG: nicotinate-nucleotide adenylyltransferase [Kiritimatiellae bacterium]|nr:nicotinate-nucleotide adenylyltransferase [Kiritimatiellia bacterium]